MRTYLLIAAAVVLLVAGISFFVFRMENPASGGATTGTGLPVASSTATGTQGGTGTGTPLTLSIATVDGTAVATNDFINNGVTAPDVANPGNYYLAGSPGYCTNTGVCPAGASTTDFIIAYTANTQVFTIALTEEPIGQARMDAEQFLMQALGITQAQMCNLKYYLGTDVYTNAQFGGKNLGFSFCPGATKLPN